MLPDMSQEHVPVLAGELEELLAPQPGETAIDCTFGAGGHARQVAARIAPGGTLVCIDRDAAAEERFAEFAAKAPCQVRFIGDTYDEALRTLSAEGLGADIVYLDLGVSSLQLDSGERGFSYSYDAPLDMRMDPRQAFTARDLLNEWPQGRIAQTLRRFGEERYATAIAREIVRRRPLETTSELVRAIKAGMPAAARFGGGHPARRSFQAIRIAVNGELEALDRGLPEAFEILRGGGRMAAISFHSLEDRRVKRFFAELARGCICPPELPVCQCGRKPRAELLTRRAVSAGAAELARNPRSRAAHLRAALKLRAPEGEG